MVAPSVRSHNAVFVVAVDSSARSNVAAVGSLCYRCLDNYLGERPVGVARNDTHGYRRVDRCK